MVHKRGMMVSIQLMLALCFLTFLPWLCCAEVTLTVGDGSGSPGSLNNLVEIELANPVGVRGVQMEVCDAENYLTCAGCSKTERTGDFECMTNELDNGCVKILMWSFGKDEEGNPYVIEEGTGPVLTLNYSVKSQAPGGACRALTPQNVLVPDELNNALEVTLESGQFCVISPTTTTTTVPLTTTTTTIAAHSYKVVISPSLATLDSGATLQFSAKSTEDGKKVEGTYSWQIVPDSTIESTIDENGLFKAGENNTKSDIQETVKVTDTAHQNKSATAMVTIKIKEEPPPECTVKVNPSTATVTPGESLTFSASTIGDEGCAPGEYEWSITTQIESVVDQGGLYTAGNNATGAQVTDTVTVVDQANLNISGSATIKVEPEEIPTKSLNVFPEVLFGSRWIPLPYLLIITSEDMVFDLSSDISFEPADDIIPLLQVGFCNIFLSLVILNANPDEGTIEVVITTGEEVAAGEMSVVLLPFPLGENHCGITKSESL